MDFYDLDLNDLVLDALDDMNFTETTPIQEHTIPCILDGRDVMGIAQTGTGKTAAYLLPVLSLLQDGGFPKDAINCVIMSPTRELAQQIDQAMQGFSYHLDGISSVAVYGGNDGIRYEQEKRGMQQGADVVIATPGRLISHLSLGNIDLSRVSFFILDEADRMLDMGFSEDILQIEKVLPKDRQTIMFSATMPQKILDLARTILNDPVEVKLAVSKPAENIQQNAYICHEAQKLPLVKHLFAEKKPERVIIFTGSKVKTKDLAITLIRAGFNARAMHSDLEQSERDEAMYAFRAGKVDILVATDIVARGIDIDDIQLVINYDVPRDEEDYVHRIGRTARAGRNGRAITLVNEKDQHHFRQIERFLEKDVEKLEMPAEVGEGPAYKPSAKRDDRKGGRSRGRGSRGGSGRKDRQGRSDKKKDKPTVIAAGTETTATTPETTTTAESTAEAPKKRSRRRKPAAKKTETAPQTEQAQPSAEEKPIKSKNRRRRRKKPAVPKDGTLATPTTME